MNLFGTEKPQAQQYFIRDKQLKCMHCSGDMFHKRSSQLPMRPATLKDWANRDTVCYECSNCGFIHWFGEEKKP